MAHDGGTGRLSFRPAEAARRSASGGGAGDAGAAGAGAGAGPLRRPLEPYDGPLGVGAGRDGVLYIPETVEPGAPLILFLHGAGGTGRRELRAVVAAADRYGTVVVAPDSRGPTWDIIFGGGYGPDVEFIDETLVAVTERYDVDLSRLAIGGVSDGASYALSVGLTNGDVFPSIIAYSPGFASPGEPTGQPRIFISHGTRDPVLPIDACSRRLVGLLRSVDYDVTYEEFDGGHTVPPPVADEGFGWWLAGPDPGPAVG